MQLRKQRRAPHIGVHKGLPTLTQERLNQARSPDTQGLGEDFGEGHGTAGSDGAYLHRSKIGGDSARARDDAVTSSDRVQRRIKQRKPEYALMPAAPSPT